jgi:hypothetical protein
VLLIVTGILLQNGTLTATTQTIAWCVIFFFASAGASAAYLTVSGIFARWRSRASKRPAPSLAATRSAAARAEAPSTPPRFERGTGEESPADTRSRPYRT